MQRRNVGVARNSVVRSCVVFATRRSGIGTMGYSVICATSGCMPSVKRWDMGCIGNYRRKRKCLGHALSALLRRKSMGIR